MKYVLISADKATNNVVVVCIILIPLNVSLLAVMPINCRLL